jgi:golgi SNAP receptor complex member 2
MGTTQSLDSSHRIVDDILAIGTNVMESFHEQRHLLYSAHRRAVDVVQQLGLAQTLIGMTRRRNWQDRWIVYIGMALVSLLLVVIWWYVL